jgi:hypothetical protein
MRALQHGIAVGVELGRVEMAMRVDPGHCVKQLELVRQ